MELHDLLERLVAVLERLQIPYLITGSVAAMAYGEPRLTNNIDVVVDLDEAHVAPFAAQFPRDEYSERRGDLRRADLQGPIQYHSSRVGAQDRRHDSKGNAV